MIRRPPISTRTDTLFPYTTRFRSIEDRAIIGAPVILDDVAVRHFALRPAGAVGQRLAPPDRARVGRHDRPVHAGEAALKKGRGQPEDAVRRLEPRREALAPRFLAKPPETHEGVHLEIGRAHV